MASLIPRPPYTPEELQKLYPPQLQLEQVQIILRHGERTPVSARFQNAGLPAWWPYCQHAQQFKDIVMASKAGSSWETMTFKRRLETFDGHDMPVTAKGKLGEIDGICQPGELTTKGRETTLALGSRLRHLYVDQLRFLPETLNDSSTVTLRATPIQRALESVQQVSYGLYPPSTRTATCPSPTIIARAIGEETLFPNTGACRRFAQLFEMFTERAAQRWNDTEDMEYINQKIGKWMPDWGKRIKVDGKPRLSGIMDTINATKAHGNDAKLPQEFYDEKMLKIIDKIACDEWYTGYHESKEYRMLGIGSLVSDLTTRMIWHVEQSAKGENNGVAGADSNKDDSRIWLAGAHDTTLAGVLAAVGAFGDNSWPPFTSHIAVELFKTNPADTQVIATHDLSSASSWWSSFLPFERPKDNVETIARKPTKDLSESERTKLRSHYVRLRYNSVPVIVPGCKKPGRHLEGDESFCSLDAFKEIVEDLAPAHWKAQCRENLNKKAFPEVPEPAGFTASDTK